MKTIAESEFAVKPKGHSKTPEGQEPHSVKGKITREDLQRKLGTRPSASSLTTLKENNLIEILSEYDVYHNTADDGEEPSWELRTYSKPAYKTTRDGDVAVKYLKFQ